MLIVVSNRTKKSAAVLINFVGFVSVPIDFFYMKAFKNFVNFNFDLRSTRKCFYKKKMT